MQDDRGIIWQRDFTLTLNSATCDGSCGGFFVETFYFTDFPMHFGSHQQAPTANDTIPCDSLRPQQVSLMPTIAAFSGLLSPIIMMRLLLLPADSEV